MNRIFPSGILLLLAFAFSAILETSAIGAEFDQRLYYQPFAAFAKNNFSSTNEPLITDFCGNTLQLVDSGKWVHGSPNAITVAFETNLPAFSQVEYGPTSSYGNATTLTNEYHFIHVHYLTGLTESSRYHYRINAMDERGNVIHSADMVIDTASFSGSQYVPLPGSIPGPPYVLDRANTTYYLTDDITVQQRAITIAAAGISIDLNGHTLSYDAGEPSVAQHSDDPAQSNSAPLWTDYFYSTISTVGIYGYGNALGNGIITGGTIRQILQHSGTIGMGFNPILLSTLDSPYEIAGLTIEWGGGNANGIYYLAGNAHIHHNVLKDIGAAINNRSFGVAAIYENDSRQSTHHNLIRRTRHLGIRTINETYSNEILGDSYAINGYLIRDAAIVHDNKIFGTGYHSLAASTTNNAQVYHNLVYMVGDAPTNRNPEYGLSSSVNGFRITQYGGETKPISNCVFRDNTIIIKARNGASIARGIEVTSDPNVVNAVFKDNIVKAVALDNITTSPVCVVGQGSNGTDDTRNPVFYRKNKFISNLRFVAFCDSYACGGNHRFEGNTFERMDSNPSFHSFSIGYWIWNSYNNRLIDSTIVGDASIDDVIRNEGGVHVDYSVGHSVYALIKDRNGNPVSNKSVTVIEGTHAYETTTDSTGIAVLQFLDYTWASLNQEPLAKKEYSISDHKLNVSGFASQSLTYSQILPGSSSNPITITLGAARPAVITNLVILK